MKRLGVTLFAFLLCFPLYAQDYVPFVEDGKAWNYVYHVYNTDWSPKYSIHYSYLIEGDTTIAGETWKKLYYIADRTREEVVEVRRLEGALREEGRKVFFYENKHEEIFLLFDFTLSVGDSCLTEIRFDPIPVGHDPMENGIVREIVPIELNSGMRSTLYRFVFQADPNYPPMQRQNFWIEGIGSAWGISPNLEAEVTGSGFGWVELYLSCTMNDEVLVTGEEVEELLGLSAIRQPSLSSASPPSAYDITGRQIIGDAKGLVIRSGKKMVAR